MTAPVQSFWQAFTPKLIVVWREGQIGRLWRGDALAGLTVAIVALPLAMALGIASGASPNQGLVTAIIAGFLISLLGGSRVQIGGPTGAFVVIVAGVIAAHGYAGLIVATLLAGFILIAAGYAGIGKAGALHPDACDHGIYRRHRGHHRLQPGWRLLGAQNGCAARRIHPQMGGLLRRDRLGQRLRSRGREAPRWP